MEVELPGMDDKWSGELVQQRLMPRSWVIPQEAEHCICGIAVGRGKPSSHITRLVKMIPDTWRFISDTADGSRVHIHLYKAVPETDI